MRFEGRVWKDGKHWLAEIPILDAMTQGTSKKDAYAMVADLIETMVNVEGFSARVYPAGKERFEVGGSEPAEMTALLLRQLRQRSGISLKEAADKLGAKSRNAYARYEQGSSVPTIEKLEELISVVGGSDFVIKECEA